MVITGLTQRAPPGAEDPNGFTSPRTHRLTRVVELPGPSAGGGARWKRPVINVTSAGDWTSGGYGGRPPT